MNFFTFLPLFGLALWLGAIYVDSKFSYKTPAESNIKLRDDVPWWKKVIVCHNHIAKYGALFLLWLAISADVYLFRAFGRSSIHYIVIAISGISILVYILAQAWRFIVKESDKVP